MDHGELATIACRSIIAEVAADDAVGAHQALLAIKVEPLAVGLAQLDQRRHGSGGRAHHELHLQPRAIPARSHMVEERPVFGARQRQAVAAARAHHVLDRKVHAQIFGRENLLAQLIVDAFLAQLGDVGLVAARHHTHGELVLQIANEGTARRRRHEPVLDHRIGRIAGELFEVEADVVALRARLRLDHPVQRGGENGARIQPDAAMAPEQFRSHPVGALGSAGLLQCLGDGAHIGKNALLVEDADLEAGAHTTPIGKAAADDVGLRGAAPERPEDARDAVGVCGCRLAVGRRDFVQLQLLVNMAVHRTFQQAVPKEDQARQQQLALVAQRNAGRVVGGNGAHAASLAFSQRCSLERRSHQPRAR
ncbi:hypothetical protein SDC9_81258 [bioreactor metagenome]|uniref:Uncharacterized protein n=1 Tax=bioreactor metagenome TaxID=1076179 RepID=A0A644Z3V1_9ZZZZ